MFYQSMNESDNLGGDKMSVNKEQSTLMVLPLVQECAHACDPLDLHQAFL